jgi:hypothetical protein
MPIFIPIVIGGVSVVVGGIGACLAWGAKKRISAAKKRLDAAAATYKRSQAAYTRKGKETESAFSDLGQTKLQALKTLGETARFLRNARVRERTDGPSAKLEAPQLAQWEAASVNALQVLAGAGSGGLVGASTAAGVYGLVGLLGTASTGTAISTLTGIAASNATLAWLGGGAVAVGGGGVAVGTAVLGGVVAGPVLLATGIGLCVSASRFETKAEKRIAEMKIAQEEMKARGSMLGQVIRRAHELAESITKTESTVRDLLRRARNGKPETAYDLFKAAKTLAMLIDTAILDEDGNLVQ